MRGKVWRGGLFEKLVVEWEIEKFDWVKLEIKKKGIKRVVEKFTEMEFGIEALALIGW